jgi:uncharacterized protein YfiM (DUF2279 family)
VIALPLGELVRVGLACLCLAGPNAGGGQCAGDARCAGGAPPAANGPVHGGSAAYVGSGPACGGSGAHAGNGAFPGIPCGRGSGSGSVSVGGTAAGCVQGRDFVPWLDFGSGCGVGQDPPGEAGEVDAWLGADKFQHFGMSFAITAYGFGAARTAGLDTGAALRVALPVAAAAGVGKEIHDRGRGGPFSVRDLVADALGIAAAWLILREVR